VTPETPTHSSTHSFQFTTAFIPTAFRNSPSAARVSCGQRRLYSLHPVIDRVFPFDEAREALHYLESGTHFGKIISAALRDDGVRGR
jgi:Zinc-binding dehydrogenase